ncbi:MAG: hypothetical protein QXW35_04200 [Candidatus Aenigmatarchaeota archaeon]
MNIIDKIYQAELPYFTNYKEQIYNLFLKSIQFHPLNRLYDEHFFENLFVYGIKNIDVRLFLAKTKNFSSIALIEDYPPEYSEEYINRPIINIVDNQFEKILDIRNTELVYVGYFIHLFSRYCPMLNKEKNKFSIGSVIERKPLYNFKLKETTNLKENEYYISEGNLTYYLENLTEKDGTFFRILFINKPDNLYKQKPKNQNIYGTFKEFIFDDIYVNNAIALPFIASKIRNSIRYPDINYIRDKAEIIKSDIQTIIKVENNEDIVIPTRKYKIVSNFIYPINYIDDPNISINEFNIINLNGLDQQIQGTELYAVTEKSEEFHYNIYLDNSYINSNSLIKKHQIHIIYEYDFPPIIHYITNQPDNPYLIMRYKNNTYLLITLLPDNVNIVEVKGYDMINGQEYNISYTINDFVTIDNQTTNIKYIVYKPNTIKQYHNLIIRYNNEKYTNILFKTCESIIPFDIFKDNIITVPYITKIMLNYNYNDYNEFIQKNVNKLLNLAKADNTYIDNFYYVLSNDTKWLVESTFNIYDSEILPFTNRILFCTL